MIKKLCIVLVIILAWAGAVVLALIQSRISRPTYSPSGGGQGSEPMG